MGIKSSMAGTDAQKQLIALTGFADMAKMIAPFITNPEKLQGLAKEIASLNHLDDEETSQRDAAVQTIREAEEKISHSQSFLAQKDDLYAALEKYKLTIESKHMANLSELDKQKMAHQEQLSAAHAKLDQRHAAQETRQATLDAYERQLKTFEETLGDRAKIIADGEDALQKKQARIAAAAHEALKGVQ